jgi:hypothetical protein
MRVNDAVTYEIAPVPVSYYDSTPDARKVYFTTAQALIPEDEDTSLDLYMWSDLGGVPSLTVVSQGPGGGNGSSCEANWTPNCNIEVYRDTQISNAAANKGGLSVNWHAPPQQGYSYWPGNTGVKGKTDNAVAAETGDIAFYSPEDLDGTALARGINLFLYRNGEPQLVATLEDDLYCIKDESAEGIAEVRYDRCSDGPIGRLQITPDGRYLAFVTTSRLTSYDNQGKAVMYRYESETRRIVCISCKPDGTPPIADVFGSFTGRFISDDGRVWFTSKEEIDPRDSNTTRDVLTGEPLGADVYQYSGGVPTLISTGTGQQAGGLGFTAEAEPGLLGVSSDGVDVYFMWTEPLAGQDENGLNNYRIYNARSGGGFLYNPPAPPCEAGDECHDIPSQPAPAVFSGTSAPLAGGNANSSNGRKKAKKRKKKRKAKRNKRRGNRNRGKARKRHRSHRLGAGKRGRASNTNAGGRR